MAQHGFFTATHAQLCFLAPVLLWPCSRYHSLHKGSSHQLVFQEAAPSPSSNIHCFLPEVNGYCFYCSFSFHFLIQDILLLLLFLFPLYLCSSLFSLPLLSEHLFSSFTGASDALKAIDFLFLKSLLEIYLLLSLAREGYLPWHHAIF